ncbi:hypothetical protein OG598_14800 [Micromonospora sp. NBC_00330]|uniref:hypothetical protein n=1 Tax=Micromonospora sp. NBC_00330 TaxID=2903585 RepID=UPI002E2D8294|nr:hypothetical protein [Micromonospora sp. NBC_00330]
MIASTGNIMPALIDVCHSVAGLFHSWPGRRKSACSSPSARRPPSMDFDDRLSERTALRVDGETKRSV